MKEDTSMNAPAADQADASEGGSGAPPDPQAKNRAPAGLTREYRSEEISVLWFAERCIHSAACIRALPGVFDPKRRPWVDIDAAGADQIADAVLRCPTGALHFARHDGGPQEPVPESTTIQTVPDGPLYVRGDVVVTTPEGYPIRRETRAALCRCGQSEHMPFCDNSHRAISFRDSGMVKPATET